MVVTDPPTSRGQAGQATDAAGQSNAGAHTAPRAADAEQPRYTLLEPPNYDNIVGGAPPSPFVSALLALGLVLIVLAAAGSAFGLDVSDWWLGGGLLAGIALLLAAFVSRTG